MQAVTVTGPLARPARPVRGSEFESAAAGESESAGDERAGRLGYSGYFKLKL